MNVSVIHLVFVGLGLFATVIIAVTKAVRAITQDNANTASALTKTITSEVSSLKIALTSIQEKHAAAVVKVDGIVMPRLDDHETRIRTVEHGHVLAEFLDQLSKHKGKAVGA